jgi:hypothetical protein
MFERSELRSSREGRKENSVKNLNESEAIPKILSLSFLLSRKKDVSDKIIDLACPP